MRRTVLLFAIIVGTVLCIASPSAQAQQSLFGIGPKAGFYLKGDPMIGAVAEFLFTRSIIFEPGVEVIFEGNSITTFVADANLRYAFQVRGETYSPFLLGGLGLGMSIASQGSETETDQKLRLNLGGGLTFNTRASTQFWGGLKIYTELTGDDTDSDVSLQAGVIFYL